MFKCHGYSFRKVQFRIQTQFFCFDQCFYYCLKTQFFLQLSRNLSLCLQRRLFDFGSTKVCLHYICWQIARFQEMVNVNLQLLKKVWKRSLIYILVQFLVTTFKLWYGKANISKKPWFYSEIEKIISVLKRSPIWQSLPGNVNLNCWRQTDITLSPACTCVKNRPPNSLKALHA